MRTIALLLLWSAAFPALAALEVFACTPEWASLAKALGGPSVDVYAATTARQDPHRIEARPSLIARARRADLVVCTGADLEIAWLPQVLARSGNARIQPGQRGYFEAASVIELRDKPARLDRALGDVHAAGNPHLHLDPRNIAKVAQALGERMAEIDSAQAAAHRRRTAEFLGRWSEATRRWEAQGAPLEGVPVIVHHRNLTYLLAWLGLEEVSTLEPKPGVPPGTAHLAEVLEIQKRKGARMVLHAAYDDPRAAAWLAERASIPAIALPYTVGGNDAAKDLFSLFDDTLARLLAAAP